MLYNDQLCTYTLPAVEQATQRNARSAAQTYTKFGNDPVNGLGRVTFQTVHETEIVLSI